MSRRSLFGSLCAMVFLVNLARVVFAPLVQPVAAEFGVPAASLGVVTSAAWLGSAAPRLPTGYLLTRFPRHHVVAAAGSVLAVAAAGTAFADSIPLLAAGAFAMGLSSGVYFIAANPLVSELFRERVGTAIGVHGAASQLAAVAAPVFLSVLLVVGRWETAFFVISGCAVLATGALVLTARRTALPSVGAADRSLRAAARAQWKLVLTGVVFIGAAGFLWNGLFNLYGDYLTVVKGIDPGTGRLLLSGMFAAGVPAFFLTGRLADRVPNVPLILGIIAGFVVCTLALTAVTGVLAVAAVSVVLGFAVHALFPAMDTYMLSALPDHHRGSAYALYSATMMVVQALGSGAVGMAVAQGLGYTAVFRGLAVGVGALVLALYVLYTRDRLPTGGTPGETPAAGATD
ncbi:MFS transporter [Salinirussus salinus]|uniref:MFS transporter n=1 Tax=Salinirussus salinus TaxID=1198300 RepID=UPI001359454D|nr:MFS transporter [Salinirussus salinus]